MTELALDLIVLGAGSAGVAAANRAAEHGARVALLDPGLIGGTCVNVGCVPKKAMWHAAELADALVLARDYGFEIAAGPLHWPSFVDRRDAMIAAIRMRYRERLQDSGVRLLQSRGQLSGAGRVQCGERQLQAPHVLIATGGRPRRATVPGGELGIDSDGFFGLRAAPQRIAIVGGGYIATELSGLLRALGSQVQVLVRDDHLLAHLDSDITEALCASLRRAGIQVRLQTRVAAVTRMGQGYCVELEGGERCEGFDQVLWAIGRVPNSAGMGLAEAGVALGEHGHVQVDAFQNTSVAGVYAVGDVTPRPALTPVAVAAARQLMERLFGGRPDARLDYGNIPTTIFGHPPLGSVGVTEAAARDRYGDAVRCYVTRFRPMRDAVVDRAGETLMKLVCIGPEERVVGLHLIGLNAEEILQGFAVAVRMGARKADLDATVALHPTSAEELVLMRSPVQRRPSIAPVGSAP